jgi:transposase InsO family protein
MRRFIKKYIKNCLDCLFFKSPAGKLPGELHPIPKVPRPFHTVHVDHLGPFVKTKKGNTYVFVAIDAFTKFILLYAVRNTKTNLVTKSLQNLIHTFGVPHRIISDQGTAFTSKTFTQFCREKGINKHLLNATGMPRGNGQVERYNRTIIDSPATMGAGVDDDRWDENIINIQLGLNGTVNKSIGVTPSQALMVYRVVTQGQLEPEARETADVTAVRARIAEETAEY